MNREEFSKMLKEARQANNTSVKDFFVKADIMPNKLYLIENAVHSYRMDKCFAYLNAVDHRMIIIKDKKRFKLSSCDDTIAFIKAIKGDVSERKFADSVGCSFTHLGRTLRGQSLPSIDFVLLIANACGYTITLEPYGR